MTVTPIASLGMYDGGDLTAPNDDLFRAVTKRLRASGLRDLPGGLTRDRVLGDLYEDPGLLLGHICGYPLAARYQGALRVIGVPEYDVSGCVRAHHRSFLVTSAGADVRALAELRGSRAAVNATDSMTGRHLLGEAVASLLAHDAAPFFASTLVTGSHASSLAAVARGEADVAAIDCVSYDHLTRSQPEDIAATRVFHRTRTTPGLPFVVAAAAGEVTAHLVARALAESIADPALAAATRALRLVGLRKVSAEAYDATILAARRADAAFEKLPRRTVAAALQSTITSEGGTSPKSPATIAFRRSSVAR